ncbi:MAG TPA: amidase [Actinomycetes bacterium]|nr:amidase [Actinomycetes bacterium]
MTQQHPLSPDLSSAEQVDHLINRIGEIDAAGPQLRSVIEVNPDAMAIAVVRDAERREGHLRSPLHGTPILIKDNIDTADAMLTTAGSLAMTGNRPREDAEVVARLREAGMVLLGKTNLSEWANLRSPHSTSGWSGRGGLTRNPWDTSRSAGGSSAGSGAALAAELAPLALGTETDGSIVCPASYCGVVGLKPTVGRIPQAGIIPIAHSQDTAGPMARSVRATALLMDVLCNTSDHLKACDDERGVNGLRIGVVRSQFGHHAATDSVADHALSLLASQGATVIDPVELAPLPTYDDGGSDELTVLLHEFKHDLDRYLASRPEGTPRDMAEIIAFNRDHADAELKWFGQEFMEQAVDLPGLDDDAYVEARRRCLRQARDEGLDTTLRTHELDALVAPAFPPAITIDLVNGDAQISGDATTAPAIAGYPILSVPMGLVHDLPVGLAVVGAAKSEPTLLRVGFALESALGLLAAGAFTPPI